MSITKAFHPARIWLLSGLLAIIGLSLPAHGDWSGYSRFNTIAELDIEDDAVHLELCFRESALPRLAQLTGHESGAPDVQQVAQRLLRLSADQRKSPTARELAVRKIMPGPAKSQPADCSMTTGAAYAASLTYQLSQPAKHLAIRPPDHIGADDLGLMVLHRGVPVTDLTALQGPVHIELDDDDAWRSRVDSPAFIRRHNEPRSYLYVEPYEVRHELLVRVAERRPVLDLGIGDRRYLEEADRARVLQSIGSFLQAHNPLLIDGAALAPQLDRVQFVHYTRAGVQPIDATGRIDARTALVGVVLVYLTEHPAHSLRLRWDLFGNGTPQRQVSVIQGQESFDGYVTPAAPHFDWSQDEALDPIPPSPDAAMTEPAPSVKSALPARPLAAPPHRIVGVWALLLGIGLLWRHRRARSRATLWFGALAGSAIASALLASSRSEPAAPPPITTRTLVAALEPLLHNAYRAFQLRGEESAYDRLALSLAPPLLDDIYLQQRRAILRQAEGLGGEGKIERIEIVEATVENAGPRSQTYPVDVRWVAHGTVSHWGHSHPRQNAYHARITLRPDHRGRWKIVGLTFLDGQRLAETTPPRDGREWDRETRLSPARPTLPTRFSGADKDSSGLPRRGQGARA